jgi:hypothetical protein
MEAIAGKAVLGALATKAAIPIAQGVMGFASAKSQQERARANAYIGRTRAMQTDTAARQGLSDELSMMRNAFGASGQRPSVGTLEIMSDLRAARDSERRVQYGNRMSEVAGFNSQARAAGGQAFGSLLGGALRAGPSMFDIYEYRRKQE